MKPLLISLLVAAMMTATPASAQSPAGSAAQGREPGARQADATNWLQPVQELNRSLPPWLEFGGEYRLRLEGQDGIKFGTTDDSYVLGRLRLNLLVKPARWFSLFGETQDSRIFFNEHLPSGLPYRNTWDIRQAYAEFGSSTEGWVDVIAGRAAPDRAFGLVEYRPDIRRGTDRPASARVQDQPVCFLAGDRP